MAAASCRLCLLSFHHISVFFVEFVGITTWSFQLGNVGFILFDELDDVVSVNDGVLNFIQVLVEGYVPGRSLHQKVFEILLLQI